MIKLTASLTRSSRSLASRCCASHTGGSDKSVREQILDAALPHVASTGWSQEALRRGARDLQLSQSAAGMVEDGEAALVSHFWHISNAQWKAEMHQREGELSELELHAKLKELLKTKLQQLQPHANTWAQALAIQMRPSNVRKAVQLRADFADEVWHRAGDSSVDMSWYMRRGLIASSVLAGEVAQITDMSPHFQQTREFVDRRVDGVLAMDEHVGTSTSIASNALDTFGHSVVSLLSRLRN
jgi:ubiquinone biosynthesis protein COQ9